MNERHDLAGIGLHAAAIAFAAAAAWHMPLIGAGLLLVQAGLFLRSLAPQARHAPPDENRYLPAQVEEEAATVGAAPADCHAEAAASDAALIDFFERLGRGDLMRRLPEGGGRLTDAANEAVTQFQTAVDEALAIADLMAGGDLSTRASGAYSGSLAGLRDSLNAVQDGLRQMLTTTLEASGSVAGRGAEMRTAFGTVLDRTEAQARAVADLTAAIGTLSASVSEIARRVAAANEATSAARAVVERGQAATAAAGTALGRMTTDAEAIRGILATIDGLAQQTNVLAINASIEAARAGTAGRGFAVVSDEVRSLAGRTKAAAGEIRDIVRRTAGSVEDCAREVSGCGALMGEIAERVRDIEGISSDILAASTEQQALLDDSRGRTEHLGLHAAETGDLVRAAGGTAQGLDAVVGRLRADLDRFRLTDETMIEEAIDRAAEVSRRFEDGLAAGRISERDLFSADYSRLEGIEPAQFVAPFTTFTDAVLPDILESALGIHEGVVFCAAVNADGYLPTHNRKFSQTPRPGDPVWNAAHARNRRFFADRVGLAAGRSQARVLIQAYRRDMGGGTFVTMKDISAPITVRGRHWGGLRIGYRPFLQAAARRDAA